MSNSIAIVGGTILAFVSAGFVLSAVWKRNDLADVMWGPGVWLASVTALVASGHSLSSAPLVFLVCGLTAIWAARIAWHIGRRFLAKPEEDHRYAGWRTSWRFFYVRSYFQVFLLQGLLMILVAASAIAATFYDDGRQYQTVVLVIGSGVFWFGLVFEAVADMQLTEFMRAKRGRSQILTTGLWRYSRHPNYFGEVTAWWGLWIIAVAPAIADPTINTVSIALLAMISPITITILILKVSGIPMLEAKYAGNKTFEAYKQRTSAFFPWFPGSAVRPGVDPAHADPQAEPPPQHAK